MGCFSHGDERIQRSPGSLQAILITRASRFGTHIPMAAAFPSFVSGSVEEKTEVFLVRDIAVMSFDSRSDP